ncbi:hypothetical protein BS47DRAFT_107382 [Hydnum rufescens UP504]|uniref:Uncharacterized protein n=1 Tax=Hydnum rufescens UP504 TaxID=1448309 RepID=A0A9P6AQG8_9AGAM|nr:hypothetical protein BS47DRAFT_107382 [Hydnum rufescens UP504]
MQLMIESDRGQERMERSCEHVTRSLRRLSNCESDYNISATGMKEQEKLRGSQEEGAVYAWPPKTSASTGSRHPHASSSTKAHIVTPSSPSSPSSSPEALPRGHFPY